MLQNSPNLPSTIVDSTSRIIESLDCTQTSGSPLSSCIQGMYIHYNFCDGIQQSYCSEHTVYSSHHLIQVDVHCSASRYATVLFTRGISSVNSLVNLSVAPIPWEHEMPTPHSYCLPKCKPRDLV